MRSLRLLLAAPFMIVSGIAYLLMGLQLPLAMIALLSGASLVDALLQWILNTAFFGIVGTVAGVVAWVIGGLAIQGGE